MAREILFRGKTLGGQWVEGDLVHDKQGACITNAELGHLVIVQHETVGQFTGKKDTDGNRVFEGDIIENEKGDITIIDFFDFSASFNTRSYFGGGVYWWNQKFKVSGNIHDNPEFLK